MRIKVSIERNVYHSFHIIIVGIFYIHQLLLMSLQERLKQEKIHSMLVIFNILFCSLTHRTKIGPSSF